MKDQVTSIEQSKRLIELGVPADKASMVYRKRYIKNEYVLDVLSREMEVIAPAFTVADLLEKVLPNVIQDAHNTYELTLKAVVGGGWRFCYTPVLTQLEADNIGEKMGDSLIELLCNRIEWAVSNGYGLNL
ncbi:hypothetical protein [Alistipes finegoldii]|jgi:hypothetical protein|uniref:hypothetical protein n=1 Tax=Alistipes finegoldii TaxID=214856 RepID=UPI002805F8AA|nr:hypothetical protein [uncultured Alistipes sp.]